VTVLAVLFDILCKTHWFEDNSRKHFFIFNFSFMADYRRQASPKVYFCLLTDEYSLKPNNITEHASFIGTC